MCLPIFCSFLAFPTFEFCIGLFFIFFSVAQDLDGMVICIVASSGAIDTSDVQATLLTFRQTTEYEGEILISTIHEPSLEPNLLVTTVVILG